MKHPPAPPCLLNGYTQIVWNYWNNLKVFQYSKFHTIRVVTHSPDMQLVKLPPPQIHAEPLDPIVFVWYLKHHHRRNVRKISFILLSFTILTSLDFITRKKLLLKKIPKKSVTCSVAFPWLATPLAAHNSIGLLYYYKSIGLLLSWWDVRLPNLWFCSY